MSIDAVIEALALPAAARVDQRIPKKLLAEQGAHTAADRRLVADAVDTLIWHAALKPTTIGVPVCAAQSDDRPAVVELAVVSATLRPAVRSTQAQRLRQLIHRAIPYPVLLLCQAAGSVMVNLSLAQKRASQAEADKLIVQAYHDTGDFDPSPPRAIECEFLASLAVHHMPRADLAALYQGLIDCVTAFQAARITGHYHAPASGGAAAAEAQREALADWHRATAEIAAATSAAAKEKQLARRVELNLRVQRLRAEQLQAVARLAP